MDGDSSTFYLSMIGAVWRRLDYFAEYLFLKDLEGIILGHPRPPESC